MLCHSWLQTLKHSAKDLRTLEISLGNIVSVKVIFIFGKAIHHVCLHVSMLTAINLLLCVPDT